MAECIRYQCENCEFSVEVWSDGNPYFIDEQGRKQYAYHPSADFDKCIGNDADFLCLNCGKEFVADSLQPDSQCPKCHSKDTTDTNDLEQKHCPKCKASKFEVDQRFRAIS